MTIDMMTSDMKIRRTTAVSTRLVTAMTEMTTRARTRTRAGRENGMGTRAMMETRMTIATTTAPIPRTRLNNLDGLNKV